MAQKNFGGGFPPCTPWKQINLGASAPQTPHKKDWGKKRTTWLPGLLRTLTSRNVGRENSIQVSIFDKL